MPNPSPAVLMPYRSILKKPKQEIHQEDHHDEHGSPPSSMPSSPTPSSPTHPEVPRGKKEWWLPFNVPFHNGLFRKNADI
ncbi:hypothetical protein GCK72_011968 [Caenorhabditis remanei]|uniref:Uncharacterized protein n=1 Tax=Caenorhabditis remanei TaxID=31234 RepID=A0A6A5GJT7_CAERE|nr:hypothetical protein GCK72_011968 [Caenorhabditis remanei]KAF1755518.1 hypothetical protein GCK72_011968 [Caenorhabditis remanei]